MSNIPTLFLCVYTRKLRRSLEILLKRLNPICRKLLKEIEATFEAMVVAEVALMGEYSGGRKQSEGERC